MPGSAQVKEYLTISKNKTYPAHKDIQIRKGNRLRRGNSSLVNAQDNEVNN